MEAKARLFGHPVHQMLVAFPIGLLFTSWFLDVAFLATDGSGFASVGYWNIAAGTVGGLIASLFGLIDWIAIPMGTRAKMVGAWHAGWNVGMLTLFGASWVLRSQVEDHTPTLLAIVLSTGGLVLGSVGGWLGGELVIRLGIGISPGANLNAPSSLTDRPVGIGATETES